MDQGHPGFARLRQVGAQQVAQQMREEKARLAAQRAKALSQPTPEQIEAEDRRQLAAQSAAALQKVEAERQAGLRRQAEAREEHQAEIRLLGRALADELKPEFQALVAAIREAMQQPKEGQ
jgi:hypothetical protein